MTTDSELAVDVASSELVRVTGGLPRVPPGVAKVVNNYQIGPKVASALGNGQLSGFAKTVLGLGGMYTFYRVIDRVAK